MTACAKNAGLRCVTRTSDCHQTCHLATLSDNRFGNELWIIAKWAPRKVRASIHISTKYYDLYKNKLIYILKFIFRQDSFKFFCNATHSFYTVMFKQLPSKSKHVPGEKKLDESVHFQEAASFFVVGFFFMHEIIFPPHFTFLKQGIWIRNWISKQQYHIH